MTGINSLFSLYVSSFDFLFSLYLSSSDFSADQFLIDTQIGWHLEWLLGGLVMWAPILDVNGLFQLPLMILFVYVSCLDLTVSIFLQYQTLIMF